MNAIIQKSSKSNIHKPKKVVVPITVGLAWRNDPEFVIQEKLDGCFEARAIRGILRPLGETVVAGENVQGEYHAFDLLTLNGEDCRNWPLRERLDWLSEVFQSAPVDMRGNPIHQVPALDYQPTTLNEIWARDGEGIVRKRLDSPWGSIMEACKRLQTFTCVVTGMNAGQSVQIARIVESVNELSVEGEKAPLSTLNANTLSTFPCGSVTLGGGKCDRVRVGSILKIEGFGLTHEGKIREPRPDKDSSSSWLIQY